MITEDPSIQFAYGHHQVFRFRHEDINVIGWVGRELVIASAAWTLNGGPEVNLYIEPAPTDTKYPWNTRTPSVHRLRNRRGWFNVEIPITSPILRPGKNELAVRVTDSTGHTIQGHVDFDWDPAPVSLPLILDDLTSIESPQEIGQAVNGVFYVDRERHIIHTPSPAGPDVLFLLGSPNASQEATYNVRFCTLEGEFVGLSDFFVRHELQDEGLGIKPGYSTNGLATLTPKGLARLWMATGDCLMSKDWAWVIRTEREPEVSIQADTLYSVRHQSFSHDGFTHARFRIWNSGTPEPIAWLCHLSNDNVDADKPRNQRASFGLFRYGTGRTEWSNILVREIKRSEINLADPVFRWAKLQRLLRQIRGAVKRPRGSVALLSRWLIGEVNPRPRIMGHRPSLLS